jgi:hypothetical protein
MFVIYTALANVPLVLQLHFIRRRIQLDNAYFSHRL